ncbi:hypothetical protein BKA82DRAFT_29520 [Pisolithus tinctorius]|uniref:Uncharacterized protein n=1 Tax=Pisolithus tinctorius Marx 270 TaxID=870435 RepID=A0A0C3JSY7_PISTI|nr:hypothetical protein BKA82DRAFT_29520 [Pisolithus tinctorius]KIO00587.1 hypothetical protein M404DRAFT_29520 [Pisolithus tinctorius Marx 270]
MTAPSTYPSPFHHAHPIPPFFNVPTVEVACGYIIEQDVMNELLADIGEPWKPEESEISDLEGEEVTTVNTIICKVDRWTMHLTPKQRAGTPRILCLFPVTIPNGTCIHTL